MRLVDGMRAVIGWSMNALGMSGYNATNPRRKILQPSRRPSQATANELASSSLPLLRAYGRDLERNNPTARGAVDGTTALVVGSGIALEPEGWEELGEKRQAEVIELVRAEWMHWCETCTVDGRCLDELESQGWREQFITGEALWRLVMLNERERKGDIPLAVLPLESEWFDDNGAISFRPGPGDTVEVGALTLDKYGRMISARIKNPEMTSVWPAEQVPASALVHIFEKRRSMQSRGESWFAPVIETLQQERDLVDAELSAAVNTSSIGVVVTSEVHDNLDTTESGTSEDPAASLRLGGFTRLYPGDDIKSFANERPTQLINNFRSGLRGDTAAALRCPQRFLDRDPSRANYSSMRSDGNDTERLLGPVREWYGHATAGRLYREVLPFICAKVGVPMPKRVKYRLLPDGNPYVNPKEDIEAAILAIRSGLSTWEIEIGKRGGDAKKMLEQLEKELNEPLLQSIFSADGGPADPNAPDPVDPHADPSAAGKTKPEEEGMIPSDA